MRMEPQADAAFPIPTWQTALDNIKYFANARAEELKSNHEEEKVALAKIATCEAKIKDTKCWHMYRAKAKKIYSEFLCPFQYSKPHITSGVSSPFTLIKINDLKYPFYHVFLSTCFLVFDLFSTLHPAAS